MVCWRRPRSRVLLAELTNLMPFFAGVNNSLPRIDCFNTGTEEFNFWQGTIPSLGMRCFFFFPVVDLVGLPPLLGLEARGNFTSQEDLTAFYGQSDEVDTLLGQLGNKCLQMSGDGLKYVGTVSTLASIRMATFF